MPISMHILFSVGILMVVLGAVLMWLSSNATRKTLLNDVVAGRTGDDAPVIKPILMRPYNEVLLGVLFTISTPFFALWCVVGNGKTMMAVAVAHLTAALTSFGTFVRRKEALNELGAIRVAKRIRIQLIVFAIALFIFLSGLVLGTVAFFDIAP